MAQIERREARLRAIRFKTKQKDKSHKLENVARTPEAHHHIGKTQNNPVHIGNFIQERQGDLAVQVCILWAPIFIS